MWRRGGRGRSCAWRGCLRSVLLCAYRQPMPPPTCACGETSTPCRRESCPGTKSRMGSRGRRSWRGPPTCRTALAHRTPSGRAPRRCTVHRCSPARPQGERNWHSASASSRSWFLSWARAARRRALVIRRRSTRRRLEASSACRPTIAWVPQRTPPATQQPPRAGGRQPFPR